MVTAVGAPGPVCDLGNQWAYGMHDIVAVSRYATSAACPMALVGTGLILCGQSGTGRSLASHVHSTTQPRHADELLTESAHDVLKRE